MSVVRTGAGLLCAALLSGCGTIENNAWTNGVSREDALDLSRAVRAQKHAHEIYSYLREADASVRVSTDVGTFDARRTGGRWVFSEVIIVSHAAWHAWI